MDYFTAILYYAIFLITISITILIVSKYKLQLSNRLIEPIRLSNFAIIAICAIGFVVSFLIELKPLLYAYKMGISGYAITRDSHLAGTFFPIHQILDRIVLISVAIGLVIQFSGRNGRYFTARRSIPTLYCYITLIISMIAFQFVLGNKSELFLTLIISVLFYYINATKRRTVRMFCVSIVVLGTILMVDIIRGMRMNNILQFITLDSLLTALSNSTGNDEKFAAHFSLYGTIHYNLKPTYGSSIISLCASVVPRIFWKNRPNDIYPYYAKNVFAQSGQGYAIHHATGWYLNFGFLGIILGAIIWGWVWATLHNNFCKQKKTNKPWVQIFTIFAPWGFTAGIPSLIRAGIEGYKGIAYECIILPVIVLTLAHFVFKRSAIYQRKSYWQNGPLLQNKA